MTDRSTPRSCVAELDLVDASLGDVIALVAVGDTERETDPSEFAMIPIAIAG